MIYLAYLESAVSDGDICPLGAFLMKEDAELFMQKHSLKGKLRIKEVHGVWSHWTAIKEGSKK